MSATDNLVDLGPRDLKFACKLPSSLDSPVEHFSHPANLICTELASAVSFAPDERAMFTSVALVFGAGPPREVFKAIVTRIAVQVPALVSFGPWANERFQDKTVDSNLAPWP